MKPKHTLIIANLHPADRNRVIKILARFYDLRAFSIRNDAGNFDIYTMKNVTSDTLAKCRRLLTPLLID